MAYAYEVPVPVIVIYTEAMLLNIVHHAVPQTNAVLDWNLIRPFAFVFCGEVVTVVLPDPPMFAEDSHNTDNELAGIIPVMSTFCPVADVDPLIAG